MQYENLPDFLTVNELRRYLRVGRDKAYEISKEIPHIKNGNRRLVAKAHVLAWVEQQTESKLKKRFRGLRAVK